jgi:hypothetical protein
MNGIDETIEPALRSEDLCHRDPSRPVRESHTHVVNGSGLRWASLVVPARTPWVVRVGALPFPTRLAPSARSYHARGRRPPSLLERARQAARLVRRWRPMPEAVVIGDHTDAALEWLETLRESIGLITRWHVDAALDPPASLRTPQQNGRPRQKVMRVPTLASRVGRSDAPLEDGQRGAVVWSGRALSPQHCCHCHVGITQACRRCRIGGP